MFYQIEMVSTKKISIEYTQKEVRSMSPHTHTKSIEHKGK